MCKCGSNRIHVRINFEPFDEVDCLRLGCYEWRSEWRM